ncbi:hypothetical protein RRG08_033721 [Elysia crispata]|uniref:Uncharacterized protein n=1 Tax=Elysia crispata TaxID=231223 RepID=A0AAE1DUJ5_9GAST|nr:hypothetical protein RRG08_033721 [Elysia crispata]
MSKFWYSVSTRNSTGDSRARRDCSRERVTNPGDPRGAQTCKARHRVREIPHPLWDVGTSKYRPRPQDVPVGLQLTDPLLERDQRGRAFHITARLPFFPNRRRVIAITQLPFFMTLSLKRSSNVIYLSADVDHDDDDVRGNNEDGSKNPGPSGDTLTNAFIAP